MNKLPFLIIGFFVVYLIALMSTRGFTEPPFSQIVSKRIVNYHAEDKEWLISSEIWINKPYRHIVYWKCDGVQYNQIDSICKIRDIEMKKAVEDAKLFIKNAKSNMKLNKEAKKYEKSKRIY